MPGLPVGARPPLHHQFMAKPDLTLSMLMSSKCLPAFTTAYVLLHSVSFTPNKCMINYTNALLHIVLLSFPQVFMSLFLFSASSLFSHLGKTIILPLFPLNTHKNILALVH